MMQHIDHENLGGFRKSWRKSLSVVNAKIKINIWVFLKEGICILYKVRVNFNTTYFFRFRELRHKHGKLAGATTNVENFIALLYKWQKFVERTNVWSVYNFQAVCKTSF